MLSDGLIRNKDMKVELGYFLCDSVSLCREARLYYLDANSLFSLKSHELNRVLGACRVGDLEMTVSHWVVREFCSHEAKNELAYHHSGFKILMEKCENNFQRALEIYCDYFTERFRANGVRVLDHSQEIRTRAEYLVAQAGSEERFGADEKGNFFRDAMIFAHAEVHFDDPGVVTFLSGERRLWPVYEESGFSVRPGDKASQIDELLGGLQDDQRYEVTSILILPFMDQQPTSVEDPEYATALRIAYPREMQEIIEPRSFANTEGESNRANLHEVLDEMAGQDREARGRVLAIIGAFAPISLEDLSELMKSLGIEEQILGNVVDGLSDAALIENAGAFLLPKDNAICMEAKNQYIDELISLVEGGVA